MDNASRTPEIILKQQASLLGEKTNHIVVAEVSEAETSFANLDESSYNFYLVAPRLENFDSEYFHYRLFAIRKACTNNFYPLVFHLGQQLQQEFNANLSSKRKLIATSEQEFISILSEIFHSERTRRVIGTLLELSKPSLRN